MLFSLAGLNTLLHTIKKDVMLKPVSLLCNTSVSSGNVIFHCFEDASPLQPFLKQFAYLSDDYPSMLFGFIWKEEIFAHDHSHEVTFSDVATCIWQPVFEKCCVLIDGVQSRTIKLKDVDYYFRQFRGDNISDDLKCLFSAIEAFYGRRVTNCDWIRKAVHRMEQYWALCEQGKAAKTVLDLKQKLHLTGDFRVIEDVADRVTVADTSCTLDSIDEKLVGARSFLEKLTRDRKKFECLEKFAACLNIVTWIRKETRGQKIRY